MTTVQNSARVSGGGDDAVFGELPNAGEDLASVCMKRGSVEALPIAERNVGLVIQRVLFVVASAPV